MKQSLTRVARMAMAFAVLAMAASCSSDKADEPIVNPDNSDGTAVKAQLAINIGTTSASTGSRQTDDIVQASGQAFRGIQDIYLLPVLSTFATSGTVNSPFTFSDVIRLADISNRTDLEGINTLDGGDATSAAVYNDIAIPVGTRNFFFYGMAKNSLTDNSTTSQKHANGVLNSTLGNIPGSTEVVTFSLEEIDYNHQLEEDGEDILTALNAICAELFKYKSEDTDNPNDFDVMHQLFTATTDHAGGAAGSGEAVLNRVQTLWTALGDIDASASTQVEAIETVIKTYFSEDDDVLSWKDEDLDNFPSSLGLPDGAAYLKYTETKEEQNNVTVVTGGEFSYITDGKIGSTTSYIAMNSFVYPAALANYGATPLLATTSTNITDWATNAYTPSSWIDIASGATNPSWAVTSATWTDIVSTNTKTIGLINNINYGVAQFAVKMKAASSTLEARQPSGNTVTLSQIVPANGDYLPLTGILIADQPSSVGYNFLYESSNFSSVFSKVIYDNSIPEDIYLRSGSTSDAVRTLVLDTWKSGFLETAANSTSTNIQNIKFVLEFQNNSGANFMGVDGIVYKGQKFYLIGELKIDSSNDNSNKTYQEVEDGSGTKSKVYSEIKWSELQYPTGNTIYFPKYNNDRIFVQDFTTTATVTVNSLKNAYVTIPDLRANVLELGLSVDLAWKTGLSFDVTIE